jgi:hypothetical protein
MEIVHLGFGVVVVASMSILIKRPLRRTRSKVWRLQGIYDKQ